MDISNIALVRAINYIPFDGIVSPISEVPYLKMDTGTQFAYKMGDLLRENKILPQIRFKITQEDIKETETILSKYVPYMSDYNSMTLWAINGLVPDDSENGFGNNTFSNKKCVIIIDLEEQLKLSNIVSLMATDTAIRGSVKLSNLSIILIEQNEYNSLSEQQREQLSRFNVKTFSEDLRQAVEQVLRDTGRYIPERPILGRAKCGFKESKTSVELIELLNKIAVKHKIFQMYHTEIIENRYSKITGKLANEYENICIVNTFFQKRFYLYLSKKLNIDEMLKSDLLQYPDSEYYIQQLCDEIKKYGLEEYKKLVDEYNSQLEQLKKEGKLPTPQMIVDLYRKRQSSNSDFEALISELTH